MNFIVKLFAAYIYIYIAREFRREIVCNFINKIRDKNLLFSCKICSLLVSIFENYKL